MEKKKLTVGKVFANLIGLIAGAVVFWLVYDLIYFAITWLGNIPIIGPLLYYPSDSMAARTVCSITASVFAGSVVSAKICGNAKLLCGILIALNLFALVRALSVSALGWKVLWECGLFIGTAAMCFSINKDAADEL